MEIGGKASSVSSNIWNIWRNLIWAITVWIWPVRGGLHVTKVLNDLYIEGVNGGSQTEAILPCLRIINFNDNPIFSIEENFFLALRESNLEELSFQNTQLEYIHLCK